MTTKRGGSEKDASLVDLRAAVRGGRSELNRLDALEVLIDRAPRGLTGFLSEVALDDDIRLDVRLSAVGALGTSDSPTAIDGLVAALNTPVQPIVRRAAQRLGTLGGSAQLEDLKAVRTGNSATQDAVRFAKQLISYRHRLGQYRLTVPTQRVRADPSAAERIPVTAPSKQKRAALEERVSEPVLGLRLTTTGARELSCSGEAMSVLPSRDLVDDGPRWLLDGQAAPAAVLQRNPETGAYFPSHIVLTEPASGGGLQVHVARSSGIVVLTGRGAVRDDAITFELAAVPTPHLPPTTITGSYDGRQGFLFDTILIDRRLSPAQLRMVRTPLRQTSPIG